MSIKSTVAAVIGFTMALTVVAGASSASAQAMSLTDLVNLFISLGIISPDKAAAAKAAVANSGASTGASFSKDLTVGSSGADVTALQNKLGVSPATGYFGSVTKAAVVKYQSANGLPATGFVGALTRASLNGSSSVSMPSTPSTPVVNTGVEGILTVDKSSVSNSMLYEGQTNVPVLALKVTAKLSPISLQRIQLDLGSDTSFYTKVFKTLYVVDPSGKVLAQADLNSNTVVKSNSKYLLTLGGFNYTVPKDAAQIITITGDLYSSIPTTQINGTQVVTLVGQGVRGTDGAGIDQYAPDANTTIAQTLTFSSSLVDSAQLLISTDAANFLASDVVAAGGSDNKQYDKLPVLAFDLRAQKDTVQVTDLTAYVTSTGTGNATATSAYLYDGSTLLGSASINSSTGKASFTDINYWVPKDTTKVLTLKVDIRNAAATVTNFSASVANADVSAENSEGSSVTGGNKTGSAAGNSFSVRSVGPVFTLNSASITKSATASQNNFSTSTADATFNLTIQAVGGDIYFGDQAVVSGGVFAFAIYQNGASASLSNNTSVAWSRPSTGVVTTTGAQAFKIAQNNSVTLPVDFVFEGRTTAGALVSTGSYAVGLTSVKWSTSETAASTTSSFMSGQSAWRTPAVSLP